MRCVRCSARRRKGRLRRSTSRIHCHRLLRPPRFSTERRQVSQYSSKKRSAPSAGSHSRWCMSKCAHRRARSRGRICSKYVGARQRGEDREARLVDLEPFDERPEPLEVGDAPRRLDHEVARHAVAGAAGDVDARGRMVDRRVLDEPLEPLVGRRLEPEEDVELPAERAPRLQQLRMASDKIHAALHEDPLLADAAAAQLARQLQAARGVVPEQVVGDEDVVPDGREIVADRIDRPFAHRAIVQLPDRAERAAEGTAARGLHEPHRPVRETRVLPSPWPHEIACGHRHLVEAQLTRVTGRPDLFTVGTAQGEPGHGRERQSTFERVHDPRQRLLAVVEHHRVHVGGEERGRTGGGRVAADDERHAGRRASDACGELQHVVGFERVHRRDAHEIGAAPPEVCSTGRLKRRSTIATRCPRASSAAAMYSMPSGSILKNGPRPKRSFSGTGRRRRICMTWCV